MNGYENDYKRLNNINSFINLVLAGVNYSNANDQSLQDLQRYFNEMGLVETSINEESIEDVFIMDIHWKNITIQLEKDNDKPIKVLNFYKSTHNYK